jgi:hypothetical protein
MRLAFFILVFINLAFYVWSAGFLGAHQDGREPERLTQEISPEKVRILSELPPKQDKTDSTSAISATDCRLVSGLGADEANRVAQLVQATEGVTTSLKPQAEQPAHWVLISNLPTREAVAKKQAELKALGVTESRMAVNDAFGPYVVSLGIFSNEALAQEFLASLGKKGVRSARIVPREKTKQTVLEVRATAAVLKTLPETLAAYPGTAIGDCATSSNQ